MNRESLRKRIVARYDTRLHMSLILGTTCLMAMLASWALLRMGLADMRIRYPIVVALSYLTFLAGVWVWLRLTGFVRPSTQGSSLLDGADISLPSGGTGGGGGGGLGRIGGISRGGGSFDGGGASASWAQGGGRMPALAMNPMQPVVAEAADASDGAGDGVGKAVSGLGDLGGGDDFGLIILVIVLALAILAASGYIVWIAPDVFTEAAFGAALAGSLAKRSRDQSDAGWVAGVVKKTWWPFAIVLVLALVFASYSAEHHPEAKTFREAIHAALAR